MNRQGIYINGVIFKHERSNYDALIHLYFVPIVYCSRWYLTLPFASKYVIAIYVAGNVTLPLRLSWSIPDTKTDTFIETRIFVVVYWNFLLHGEALHLGWSSFKDESCLR